MASILIVCTGNICRSPMAEGLLRHHLLARGVGDVRVASAGVSGWDGSPASAEGVEALSERGVDISSHLARRLGRRMIDSADLVVAMAAEHREGVARMAPSAGPRTFTLKELVRLLDDVRMPPRGATSEELIREAAELANTRRAGGEEGAPLDEDIADPLGLSLPAYRATAWELNGLVERLVEEVFGEGAERGGAAAGTEAVEHRSAREAR
jgi:protein-tyrosine phosphatase